jgi:hypothetical protein
MGRARAREACRLLRAQRHAFRYPRLPPFSANRGHQARGWVALGLPGLAHTGRSGGSGGAGAAGGGRGKGARGGGVVAWGGGGVWARDGCMPKLAPFRTARARVGQASAHGRRISDAQRCARLAHRRRAARAPAAGLKPPPPVRPERSAMLRPQAYAPILYTPHIHPLPAADRPPRVPASPRDGGHRQPGRFRGPGQGPHEQARRQRPPRPWPRTARAGRAHRSSTRTRRRRRPALTSTLRAAPAAPAARPAPAGWRLITMRAARRRSRRRATTSRRGSASACCRASCGTCRASTQAPSCWVRGRWRWTYPAGPAAARQLPAHPPHTHTHAHTLPVRARSTSRPPLSRCPRARARSTSRLPTLTLSSRPRPPRPPGRRISMPVLVAPMAMHGLAHPDKEPATARGAAAQGVPMVGGRARRRRRRRPQGALNPRSAPANLPPPPPPTQLRPYPSPPARPAPSASPRWRRPALLTSRRRATPSCCSSFMSSGTAPQWRPGCARPRRSATAASSSPSTRRSWGGARRTSATSGLRAGGRRGARRGRGLQGGSLSRGRGRGSLVLAGARRAAFGGAPPKAEDTLPLLTSAAPGSGCRPAWSSPI